MLVKVPADSFKKTISFLASLQRSKMDGLEGSANILMTASNKGVLYLESFVAGMYTKAGIEGEVKEEGQVSVPYTYLSGLKFSGETLGFKFDPKSNGKRVVVQAGRFRAALAVGQDTITDRRPMEKVKLTHKIPFSDINRGIRAISFRSLDNSKLNCIVDLNGKVMRIYSHDPYRAAIYKCKNPCMGMEPLNFLAPLDILQKILASVPGQDSDILVAVGTNGKMLRFKSPFFDVHHPLMEAELDDVGKHLARMKGETDDIIAHAAFNAAEARESVASVTSIKAAGGEDTATDLLFSVKGSTVAVRSLSSTGEAIGKFDAKIGSLKQDKIAVPINFGLFSEVLSLMGNAYRSVRDEGPIDMTVIDGNIIVSGRSSGWRMSHIFSQADEETVSSS